MMSNNMRKLALTITVILAFVLIFAPAGQIKADNKKAAEKADYIVEAEKGTLTGLEIKKDKIVSGGAYVQGFDVSTDNLKMTVNIKVGGTYMLLIKYKTINGYKVNPVYLNNVCIANYSFFETKSFQEKLIGTYKLNSGTNTVQIKEQGGGIAVDYVRLIQQTGQVCNVKIALSTDKPLAYDNTLTITAQADDTAQYLFKVRKKGGKWITINNYSSSNSCRWTPGEVGEYEVTVYARGTTATVDKEAEATLSYKALEFYVGKPLLNPAFGSSMVLQRDQINTLNGWDTPNKKVEVTIDNNTYTTKANSNGEWSVDIGQHPAGGPYTISIKDSSTKVQLTDVLYGDVWLCSGQSNMEFTLTNDMNGANEIKSSNYPNIRYIKLPETTSTFPKPNVPDSALWKKCSATTTNDLSAVAYYFAKKLNKDLNVPIGIVFSAVGGTKAECWVSYDSLKTLPEYKDAADAIRTGEKQIDAWTSPIATFNAMIAPVTSLKLKGVLWYQGESNWGESGYQKLLQTLIADWRTHFNDNDLPFIIIQLPAYGTLQSDVDPVQLIPGLPEVREAQLETMLSDANVGLVTTVDLGDPLNLHPTNKLDVGMRAAICAEGKIYGQDIVYSGPIYKSMTIEENNIVLSFDFIGSGLMVGTKDGQNPVKESPDGKLTGFAVAGADGIYYSADAVISGDNVTLSSANVANPVSVRYGWYDAPVINLYNKDGLMASPFRTDGK